MFSFRSFALTVLLVAAMATVGLARENHIDLTTNAGDESITVSATTPSVAQAFIFDSAHGGAPVVLKVITLLSHYPGSGGTIDTVDVYDDASGVPGSLVGTFTVDNDNTEAVVRRVYFVNNGGVTVNANVQYHLVVSSSAGTTVTISSSSTASVSAHIIPQGVSGPLQSFDGSSWNAESGVLLWAASDTLPETFIAVDLLNTVSLDAGTTTDVPVDGPGNGVVCQGFSFPEDSIVTAVRYLSRHASLSNHVIGLKDGISNWNGGHLNSPTLVGYDRLDGHSYPTYHELRAVHHAGQYFVPAGTTHYVCFTNQDETSGSNFDLLASSDLSSSPGTIGSIASQYYVGTSGSLANTPTDFSAVTGAALSIAVEGYPLSHPLWTSLAPGHPVVPSLAFNTNYGQIFSTYLVATPFTLAQDTELTSVVTRYRNNGYDGQIRIQVYADNGSGYPDVSSPIGSPFVGENPYYNIYAAVDHVGSATLVAGVQYYLVFGLDQTSNPHASLRFFTAYSGPGATADFTTYGDVGVWMYSFNAPFATSTGSQLFMHSLRGVDPTMPLPTEPCDATATPGSPTGGMATVAVNNLAITGSTVTFDALLDDVAGVDGNTAAFAFNGATVDGSNVDPSCASGTASTFAVTLDWGFVVANFDVTTVANVAGQFPAPITAFDQYTSVMVASWTETFVETLSGETMTRSMEQAFAVVVNVPTAFAVGEPDAFIFDVAETTIAVTMKDVSMSINSVGSPGNPDHAASTMTPAGSSDDATTTMTLSFSTVMRLPYDVNDLAAAAAAAAPAGVSVTSVTETSAVACSSADLDNSDAEAFCTQTWEAVYTATGTSCSFAGDYNFDFDFYCADGSTDLTNGPASQDDCPLVAAVAAGAPLTVTVADGDACASFATVDAQASVVIETRGSDCAADRDSFVETDAVCFHATATADFPIATTNIVSVEAAGFTTSTSGEAATAGSVDTYVVDLSDFSIASPDSWVAVTFTVNVEIVYANSKARMLLQAGSDLAAASKTVAVLPSDAAAAAAGNANGAAAVGSSTASTATIALIAGVGVAVIAAVVGVAVAVRSRREVATMRAHQVVAAPKAAAPAVVDVKTADDAALSASASSASSSFVELSSSELIEFSSTSA